MNIKRMINALTIKERKNILKNVVSESNNIEIWKNIKSKLNDKQIEQMIEIRGLSHKEFNNTIQNIECITDERIINELCNEVSNSRWYKVFSDVMNTDVVIPEMNIKWELALIFMNYVNWGMNHIENAIYGLNNISVDTDVCGEIEQFLYQSLFTLAAKVSVYEYNKEKSNRKVEKYTIKNFVIEKLNDKENLYFFYYEYPVLARRLSVKIDFLTRSIIEMLRNIDERYSEIGIAYHINTSKITHVKCGSGDTHREGKTVCIITLGDKKVVYKPYKDELSKKYADLITEYNKYTGNIKIQYLKNLYFETFTIYEYIDNVECSDIYQIHCFYNRIGQLLFILHMLGANDMHCENIIANTEYPMIVDFETIIGNYNYNKQESNAFDAFVKEFSDSVVNIGFLPITIKGLQLGGLNNQGGTQSIEHEAIEKIDDQNILFRKKKFVLSSNKNVPILNGEMQDYSNYVSDIICGFEHSYYVFKTEKEKLHSALECFENTDARVVLQATQNYADIMDYSSHPKYLYDMLDLEKLFENIINPYHGVTEAILSEIDDLHNCDYPIFFANASKKNLYNYYGLCRQDFFKTTIWENINLKMNNLDAEYLKQNVVLVYYLNFNDVLNKSFWSMTKNVNFGEYDIYDKIEKIRLLLEEKIDNRIIVGEDKQTLTWLSMVDNTLNCVFSEWRNGFGGLAKYLIKLQATGKKSILLDKYASILRKMYLGKETYWGDESVGLCRKVENELYILNLYYAVEKSVEVEEKINIILDYLGKKINCKSNMSILELSGLINVMHETYELLNNYEALSILKNLGEKLIIQIRKYGYSGAVEENDFQLGHLLKALSHLYEVFSNPMFKEELERIFNSFINDIKWEEDSLVIYERKLKIGDGTLLHILSTISNVPYISKTTTGELYKTVIDKVNSKDCNSDTLRNGICARILCSYAYNDYEQVNLFFKNLIESFENYKEVRVINAPLYPELGILDGYLGILETLLLVENIK